jgi:predicted kinase
VAINTFIALDDDVMVRRIAHETGQQFFIFHFEAPIRVVCVEEPLTA